MCNDLTKYSVSVFVRTKVSAGYSTHLKGFFTCSTKVVFRSEGVFQQQGEVGATAAGCRSPIGKGTTEQLMKVPLRKLAKRLQVLFLSTFPSSCSLPFSTAVLGFGSGGDNMRAFANASSGCACGQSGGTGRGICTRRETIQAVPSPSEAHMAALNSLCLDRRARALHYFLACPLYVGVN